MGGDDESAPPPADPGIAQVEAIVPPRAVLTELARGFLLVHESNPTRARDFAATFLREQLGSLGPARVASPSHVTLARMSLGRYPRGPVEPLPP